MGNKQQRASTDEQCMAIGEQRMATSGQQIAIDSHQTKATTSDRQSTVAVGG